MSLIDDVRRVLEAEGGLAYALLFGSAAREAMHALSDIDVAIEPAPGTVFDSIRLGQLAARLESAAGWPVDLVLMGEAPGPLAYRIFRDGQVLLERDRAALVSRKARAILDYLDFRPVEERCAAGVLRAATRRG